MTDIEIPSMENYQADAHENHRFTVQPGSRACSHGVPWEPPKVGDHVKAKANGAEGRVASITADSVVIDYRSKDGPYSRTCPFNKFTERLEVTRRVAPAGGGHFGGGKNNTRRRPTHRPALDQLLWDAKRAYFYGWLAGKGRVQLYFEVCERLVARDAAKFLQLTGQPAGFIDKAGIPELGTAQGMFITSDKDRMGSKAEISFDTSLAGSNMLITMPDEFAALLLDNGWTQSKKDRCYVSWVPLFWDLIDRGFRPTGPQDVKQIRTRIPIMLQSNFDDGVAGRKF